MHLCTKHGSKNVGAKETSGPFEHTPREGGGMNNLQMRATYNTIPDTPAWRKLKTWQYKVGIAKLHT